MTGDCHVRICEGLGVKFPRATRLIYFWSNHYRIFVGEVHKQDGSASSFPLFTICKVQPCIVPFLSEGAPRLLAFRPIFLFLNL